MLIQPGAYNNMLLAAGGIYVLVIGLMRYVVRRFRAGLAGVI